MSPVVARRIVVSLAAVSLVLAARAGPVESQDDGRPSVKAKKRQRLTNPGFEKGLAGWKTEGHRLVADPLQAHSGLNCLVGEVQRRNRSLTLRRNLVLKAGRLYRLSVWARADNGSRLTVWLKAGQDRKVIANWHHVGLKWRRFRVNFTVDADGPITLGLVAPSAHWAPTGRMWIDDLALYETRLYPQLDLSVADEFVEDSDLVRASPDVAWSAWLAHVAGQDVLRAARLTRARPGLGFEVAEPVQAFAERGVGILDPVLAADGAGGAWLVFSAERQRNWDVYAVNLGPDGPAAPIRVTDDPATDVHPAAKVDGQTLWIAWESNRDTARQIYLTAIRSGQAGSARRLSPLGSNNYQPSLAIDGQQTVWTAWHSFRLDNTDIYLRSLSGGALGAERRLTRDPAVDRGAVLAAHKDSLWLAWEHANYRGYRVGQTTAKRVLLARLAGERLMVPAGLRKSGLWKAAEAPRLALDARGRPWIAARTPRDRNSGWDVTLWRLDRAGLSPGWILSRRKGMSRAPGVAVLGDQAVVAYQSDDLEGRYRSRAGAGQTTSQVHLVRVRPEQPAAVGRLPLVAYESPRERFEPARLRRRLGEDRSGWTVADGQGRSLRLLFGDLHEHSDVSVCGRTVDERPDQVFQMMRDLIGYDFGAVTDHGYNFNPSLWHTMGKRVRANEDKGRFLTLLGQEWTSTFETPSPGHPHGHHGHRNLILADPAYPTWYNALEGATPSELWAELRKQGADFVTIPHQLADSGNVPVEFAFHDEAAQPVAEIYQQRGSYECRGCPRQAERSIPDAGLFLQDAWARGIVIGVIASPDHAGGLGKAAVYAEALTRPAILEALRARRTYATTGARILLDLRVAGKFMGQVGPAVDRGQAVAVKVRLDCPAAIQQVDIIRDNQRVFRARPQGSTLELTWVDRPTPGNHWYYVRVTQVDGELAWSSPVWLGRPTRTD